MGRLADVSHRDVLAVGAEGVLAAGAQARVFARGNFAGYGGDPRPLRLFLAFQPAPAVVGVGWCVAFSGNGSYENLSN